MNVEMYFEGYLWARFFGDGYLVIGICGCNVWASFLLVMLRENLELEICRCVL